MTRLGKLIEQFDGGGAMNRRDLTELVRLLLDERPDMQYVKRKINAAAIDLAEAMDRLGEMRVLRKCEAEIERRKTDGT